MVHKSYPLRVSLLHILRLQESYVHNLQLLYFNLVLPNHSRCPTCLASVVALVNASVSVAAMEGFSATNSSANAPKSKCHWPYSATTHRVAELILVGGSKENEQEYDDHMMTKATLKRTLLHRN